MPEKASVAIRRNVKCPRRVVWRPIAKTANPGRKTQRLQTTCDGRVQFQEVGRRDILRAAHDKLVHYASCLAALASIHSLRKPSVVCTTISRI